MWIQYVEGLFVVCYRNFPVLFRCHLKPHRIQSRHHSSSSNNSSSPKHFLSISKASVQNTAVQQQQKKRYSSSSSSCKTAANLTSGLYTPEECCVLFSRVPPFHVVTPPGFQVNHVPQGNLVLWYYSVVYHTSGTLAAPVDRLSLIHI